MYKYIFIFFIGILQAQINVNAVQPVDDEIGISRLTQQLETCVRNNEGFAIDKLVINIVLNIII